MATRPHVLVLLNSDIVHDPRVKREAVGFSARGWGVDLVGVGSEANIGLGPIRCFRMYHRAS